MTTRSEAAEPVATQINVAHLLKASVGEARRYHVSIPSLSLGEGREARSIEGDIKLTRLNRGLLLAGAVEATVELTCVRCLEEYAQPLAIPLEEEFRSTIDMASGRPVDYAKEQEEGDYFLIPEDHVLDLSEALRQAAWLAAPMVPRCREDCPGIPFDDEAEAAPVEAATAATDESDVDSRLAVLGELLASDEANEPAADGPRRRSPRG
jgi:uncharacterized protein